MITLTSTELGIYNQYKSLEGFNSVEFLALVNRSKEKVDGHKWLVWRLKLNCRKNALRELNRAKGYNSKNLDRSFLENKVTGLDSIEIVSKHPTPEQEFIRQEYVKELGQIVNGSYKATELILFSCTKKNYKGMQWNEQDLITLRPYMNKEVFKRFTRGNL